MTSRELAVLCFWFNVVVGGSLLYAMWILHHG